MLSHFLNFFATLQAFFYTYILRALRVVIILNEKELTARAKKGDKQAFADLYGLYKNRLYRYAFYRLKSKEDAEDAVCDTVLSAYTSLTSLKNNSAFGSWIFKIHYVTCSKYIEKQINERQTADIDDFDNSPKLSTAASTLSSELNEVLDILSDKDREIVLLSVVAGLNSREISKIMSMTDVAVRSRLSRSLAKMRTFWSD